MSSNVPAVSDEELFMFRFTRDECDRMAWALEQRAGEIVTNDDAREALLILSRRLRDALEGR